MSQLAQIEDGFYLTHAVLKVASRCNLNCSYCYVYNKGDSTWKTRPALMSDEVFEASLGRIVEHCRTTGRKDFKVAFHGGEPCLLGHATFDRWCERLRQDLGSLVSLALVMQTNGTLLDDEWIRLLKKHRVAIGLSIDGPPDIHDEARVDHLGKGSYNNVVRGMRLLQAGGVPHGVGCVIPLGADPLRVHHHFLDLGCKQITYLMPHATHDTIGPIHLEFGPTPCADFLIPIFDDWWFNSTMEIQINDLTDLARVIVGGYSYSEGVGNHAPRYVFIEPDGEMEGLDNLRACGDGMARLRMNVKQAGFDSILLTETMHKQAIFQGMPLAAACRQCPESETCSGGYLAHRHSKAKGFLNPSVWCADLLKLFAHMRRRLGITIDETLAAREANARKAEASECSASAVSAG